MSNEISSHIVVKLLSDFFEFKGIRKFVISAGSRNAPLIISFARNSNFDCYSITDERSAAFFALGMAERLGEPVGLICTSGTALLNYTPAIAEAYYKGVPLVVMSADRPLERLDNGDGQMINQEGSLANISKFSCSLPEVVQDNDVWHAKRLLEKASMAMFSDKMGPVHINVPLREPLYETTVYTEKYSFINVVRPEKSISDVDLDILSSRFNSYEKILIVPSVLGTDEKLSEVLSSLSELPQVVVLTETINNFKGEEFFTGIDKYISSVTGIENFVPDLIITFGDILISRLIKKFLDSDTVKEHWHINPSGNHIDLFQRITCLIESKADCLLSGLKAMPHKNSSYRNIWIELRDKINNKHVNYLENAPWCDLRAYNVLKDYLKKDCDLHLGNSTVVRYAQLFDEYRRFNNFCNRGTSGIDGVISTALGSACASKKPTVVISGDLSFYYDSNALWNKYIPGNFKIVVINNEGGGIFRFIEGPSRHAELSEYFENHQVRNLSSVAESYGFDYCYVDGEDDLKCKLPEFIASEKASILEIKTPREENDKVLREYFKIYKN